MWHVKIDEENCIGCAKCLPTCPVDAIIGAPSQMHAILTEYCIGCRLCLPPCPTKCITLVEAPALAPEERKIRAKIAKQRHQAQKERLKREAHRKSHADRNATTNIKAQLAAVLAQKKYDPS